MTPAGRSACLNAGATEAAFEVESRAVDLELNRLTSAVLEARAELDDVSISVVVRRLLDSWAAKEFVTSARLDAALRAVAERGERPQRHQRLYFIRRGENGPIKIGVSEHVAGRVKQLRTGSDESMHVLADIEQTAELNERLLHARFAQHRKAGEWFAPAPELLAFIAGLPSIRSES